MATLVWKVLRPVSLVLKGSSPDELGDERSMVE